MKTILITGSEGFAGQHLWKELVENGYKVYGTALNIPEGGLPKNVFQCDIENESQIKSLIKKLKPDAIVHLAGQPKPGLSFFIPQKTFQVNTIGTLNLLEAIRSIEEYHPRILLIGTSEEHGVVPIDELPITEETPFNPINPYAISKLANWLLAKEYYRSFNFNILYASPFTHTGPGQGKGFISPDTASQIVDIEEGKHKPVIYTGDLTSRRDISDVRDVVRAYRLLLEKGRIGERYIISSGLSHKVEDIVDTLISMSKVKIIRKIDPSLTRPTDIPDLVGSHDKITRDTGWEPEIPLEKTLQDLLDWYRTKG